MAGQQCFFFFNDTATAEIYTLSLHDALPICRRRGNEQERSAEHDSGGEPKCTRPVRRGSREPRLEHLFIPPKRPDAGFTGGRSEEHTSEIQSSQYLACRLISGKKKRSSESKY